MTDNDDAMVTLTLKARDARILIHNFGYAVSKEANDEYGVRGEQLDHLWDIYYDMKRQSSRQAHGRQAGNLMAHRRQVGTI